MPALAPLADCYGSTKECKRCEHELPVEAFYSAVRRDRAGRPEVRYLFSNCKACCAEVNRERLYGSTLADAITKQGSTLCPLCLAAEAVALDHDHETGEARGALCRKCNLVMHYIDNTEWLERALDYRARGQ